MAIPGAIAGAGVLGSVIGGIMNTNAQNSANSTNMDIAQMAGEFNQQSVNTQIANQDYMSDTAYTRAAEDMKNAGINPIMAYQGQESSPSGASASMPTATVQSTRPGDVVSNATSSALAGYKAGQDFKEQDSRVAINEMQARKVEADAYLSAQSAIKVRQDMTAKQLDIDRMALTNKARTGSELSKANLEKAQADIDAKFLKFDAYTSRVGQGLGVVSKATDAINPLKKFMPPPPTSGGPPPYKSGSKKVYEELLKRGGYK